MVKRLKHDPSQAVGKQKSYREHANEESDPSPDVIREHGSALLGSDTNKADSSETGAGLLRLEEGTKTLGPNTMLGRLLSGGGVRVIVAVVQETVVGDGLENKGHVVTDGEIVLKIPADQ